jgi:hypothetical protein
VRLADALALTTRVSADATPATVHYDLHDGNGQTSRMPVPFAIHPGAFLGLAFIF